MDSDAPMQNSAAEFAYYAQADRVFSEVTVRLIQPWIVPSDTPYENKAGEFSMDLGPQACSELRLFEPHKHCGWKARSCSVVKIPKAPRHGELVVEGKDAYGYRPRAGYRGSDTVEYVVRGNDGRFAKVILTINVQSMEEAFSVNAVEDDSNAIFAVARGEGFGPYVTTAYKTQQSFRQHPWI